MAPPTLLDILLRFPFELNFDIAELVWHDAMTECAAADSEAYLPCYQPSRLKGRIPSLLRCEHLATLRPHDCLGL